MYSLTPLNGTGSSATFSAVFTHGSGVSSIYLGYLLILPTPNVVSFTAAGSCMVEFNRLGGGSMQGGIRLINDAGNDWFGPSYGLPIGSGGGILSNSFCSVDTRQVTKADLGSGRLQVNYSIQFASPAAYSFAGPLATFLQMQDVTGVWTGMTQFGNWTVSGISTPKAGPFVRSISAPPYTYGPAYVDVQAGHSAGLASLSAIHVLVNERIVGGGPRCHVMYIRSTGQFALLNDPGTDWIYSMPASNARCTIGNLNGDTLRATPVGSEVQLHIPMAFSGSVTSRLDIWSNAFDTGGTGGLTTHWIGVPGGLGSSQHYLSTAVSPAGAGSIAPASGWYSPGSVVSINATPMNGYHFLGFSGDLSGATNPQSLTMTGPKSVTARFMPYLWTFPTTGGTIAPPSGPYSGNVTVTALPSAGYQFRGFGGDLTGTANPQTLAMTGPKAVFANFQPPRQLAGPSRVEVNLGPLPISRYTSPNSDGLVKGCATNKTVGQCYREALMAYRTAHNVTGVRFQFALCGGANSHALHGCGTSYVSADTSWDTNLGMFYDDLVAAGIWNITPTPALHGFGGDEGTWYRKSDGTFHTLVNDPCRPSRGETAVEKWPASPYLIVPALNPDGFLPGPHLGFFSQSYNCSPRNEPSPNGSFIGYNWIYNVLTRAISRARLKGLNVEELDLTNEADFGAFTVQARLLYDNKYGEDVLTNVRAIMTASNYPADRVTLSSLPSFTNQSGFDCKSVYGDSARLYGTSSLLSGFGGGAIGYPSDYLDTDGADPFILAHGLRCTWWPGEPLPPDPEARVMNTNTGNMVITGRVYAPPRIVDIHAAPNLLRRDGNEPDPEQPVETVAIEARQHFSGLRSMLDSYCGGWRGYLEPLCNAMVILGETAAFQPDLLRPGYACDGMVRNGPFGTVVGFNQSTLAGRAAGFVYRPWVNHVGGCYALPQTISPVATPAP